MAARRMRLKRVAGGLKMHSRDRLIRLRDTKLKDIGVSSYRYLAVVPALLALIALTAWLRAPWESRKIFRPEETSFAMPMAGWAVRSDSWGEDSRLKDVSLVYAEVTWAELEPEENVFDFAGFEERNHLKEWWAAGKRVILRFVADRPGEEGHMDIPLWLYEAMGGEGGAGSFYQSDRGCGFAPDYSSLLMRNAHGQAIAALAERYNGHPGVAYVEIGSLGWDGEWTVETEEEGAGILPPSSVSREYAWHYTESFGDTLMLMRRPYKEVELMSAGLYNPALGDAEATWSYLDDIRDGGYDRQIETDLIAMPAFYNESPSGAHVSGAVDLEEMLMKYEAELARQISESHLSYVVLDGSAADLSDGALERLEQLGELLGYRLWLRSARWDSRVRAGHRSKITLSFRNDGAAPLHAAWPVALALFGEEGEMCREITWADSSMIRTGDTELMVWLDVPGEMPEGKYALKMAILDPATGEPGVRLGMEECDGQTLWTELGEFEVFF